MKSWAIPILDNQLKRRWLKPSKHLLLHMAEPSKHLPQLLPYTKTHAEQAAIEKVMQKASGR